MMNIVSLCVMISSLAVAGVWSPNPSPIPAENDNRQPQPRPGAADDETAASAAVIVEEGRRVIVVEYDKRGKQVPPLPSEIIKDHLLSSSTSNDIEIRSDEEEEKRKPSARELVCDALGKCRNRIASTISGAKNKISDKVHQVEDEAKETFGKGHDKIGDIKDKVVTREENVIDKAKKKAQEAIWETKEKVAEKTKDATQKTQQKGHKIKEAAGTVIEEAEERAHELKDSVAETKDKATEEIKKKTKEIMGGAKEAKDMGKTIGHDIKRNATTEIGNVKEEAKEKAKEGAEIAAEADKVRTGQRGLQQLLSRGRDLIYEAFSNAHMIAWTWRTINCATSMLHMLGFCIAYGTAFWVTFVSSHILSRALPRQQFGLVQSKIYPLYFRGLVYSIGAALLGHLLSRKTSFFGRKAEMLQGYNLLASILIVFVNLFYLEPRATKVMFERMKVEKEEGRRRDAYLVPEHTMTMEPMTVATAVATPSSTDPGPGRRLGPEDVLESDVPELSQRMKKLNSYSGFLNIVTLVSLTWHLHYLAQRLNAVTTG